LCEIEGKTAMQEITRRDVVKAAGAAAASAALMQGAPAIVKAAPEQVKYGVIGTGGRGGYLLKHLTKIDNGRCAAVCDVDPKKMDQVAVLIGTNPAKYKDYRELLADKNVEAVIIAVPLFEHYRVTKDALDAGKHVFCEKSLVFKPEEAHMLRAQVAQHPKQVFQVGLQRRYSSFYQLAKQMVDKGLLGNVTHVHAQWHRNPGWRMNGFNWRLYREYSGGLAAELASHQIDVADWIFGSTPDSTRGTTDATFTITSSSFTNTPRTRNWYTARSPPISTFPIWPARGRSSASASWAPKARWR
jgi:predicted dehydrogenase